MGLVKAQEFIRVDIGDVSFVMASDDEIAGFRSK
jgi:hypothetical protein